MGIPKRIALILGIILILIQLYPVDRSVPKNVEKTLDFLNSTDAAPEKISRIKTSCYDCHSYETNYPWYSHIAPFSWIIEDHVEEGRGHLNFSIWGEYSPKEQKHKLEECIEEVKKGAMPLKGYLTYHKEARFDSEEKKLIMDFFSKQYHH